MNDFGWNFESIQDPSRALARRLGAEYQPFVALIDADGRIVGTFGGGGTADDWAALAARL